MLNRDKTAKKLEENSILLISPSPVYLEPKQTSEFLRVVGERLDVSAEVIEDLIAREEKRAYRFAEFVGDILLIARPHIFKFKAQKLVIRVSNMNRFHWIKKSYASCNKISSF